MALTDLLKSFTRAVTLGAALYSCGGEEKQGCSTDYDCREPRVCVRGYCEDTSNNDTNGEQNSFDYERMCEDYARLCQIGPSDEGYDGCFRICELPPNTSIHNNQYTAAELCARAYCEVQGDTCLGDRIEREELTPRFLDCMDELGYAPPSPTG